MNETQNDIIGCAVVVSSLKLLYPSHSKSDEIFIINTGTFTSYIEDDDSFMNPAHRLATLRYNEDHIVILEKINSPVLNSTDFVEYKVLTKDGIGYMLHNKMHERFTIVA
jgi:hypothetical protein